MKSNHLTSTLSANDKETKRIEKERAIENAIKLIRQAQNVDLCFLLDCTGSMDMWIDAVKNQISLLSKKLRDQFPSASFKFSFVRYTDFDVGSDRTTYLDFTSDISEFVEFVSKIRAGGGDDGPEDVFGGLHCALNSLTWSQTTTKVLIHYADFPCHGREYHDMKDLYPDGDPKGITCDDLMTKLTQLKMNYFFGYIRPTATNKMISKFNQTLASVSNGQLMIAQFDGNEGDFIKHAFESVKSSISVSTSSKGGTLKKTIKTIQNAPPLEALRSAQLETGDLTRCELPSSLSEILELGFKSTFSTSKVNLRIASNPFSEGAIRYAFYASDEDTKKTSVLKRFKYEGQNETPKPFLIEIETQSVAAFLLNEFKKVCPESKASYVVASVVKLKGEFAFLEPFIEGKYKKWSNNAGTYENDGTTTGELLQAFSHWTYVTSHGHFLVCDLQGVENSTGIYLTDPAIHSRDSLKFGETNLSKFGMGLFFETHKCESICNKLGISGQTYIKPPTDSSSALTPTIPSSKTKSDFDSLSSIPTSKTKSDFASFTPPPSKTKSDFASPTIPSSKTKSDFDSLSSIPPSKTKSDTTLKICPECGTKF